MYLSHSELHISAAPRSASPGPFASPRRAAGLPRAGWMPGNHGAAWVLKGEKWLEMPRELMEMYGI